MYNVRPNTIIAFHGCDLSIRTKLVNYPNEVEISDKPCDWLGSGFYFWENNYDRALQWAKDKKAKGGIKNEAVVGAVFSFFLMVGEFVDFSYYLYVWLTSW